MKYRIRFNKSRGMPGRGSVDHAWRVFEGDKEYLFKNVKINVPSFSEREGEDWNICCNGLLSIDKETSTAIIKECDQSDICAYWSNAFTKEECEKIIELGNSLNLKEGKVLNDKLQETTHIRDSQISWIHKTDESKWIYERLNDIAFALNDQYFQYDILGFGEGLQFTCYNAPSGKYISHTDRINGKQVRKLSISIQLSDPSEYEGGDLVLHTNSEGKKTPKEQGNLTLFPSYTLHEVTEVTQGTRYSLVAWITGKPFR